MLLALNFLVGIWNTLITPLNDAMAARNLYGEGWEYYQSGYLWMLT